MDEPFWGRDEDPPPAKTLEESPALAESHQQLVTTYQDTGSIVEANEHHLSVQDLRGDLLAELCNEITPKDMASKFKELLNAKKEVLDGDGEVITSVNLPHLQLQTLKLLTEVRGDTAPIKIAKAVRNETRVINEYIVKDSNGKMVSRKVDDVEAAAQYAQEDLDA